MSKIVVLKGPRPSQMLTIADGGGGSGTPDFGWRNMWTAPYGRTDRLTGVITRLVGNNRA